MCKRGVDLNKFTCKPLERICIIPSVYIKMDFCLFVVYAFLDGWTDCDEIRYRDVLDVWAEDGPS